MESSPRLQAYFRSFDEIRGWFTRVDAALLRVLDTIQRRAGVQGDILEIGVYAGKSAVLLGFLCADGEELTVCDPFEEVPRQEFEATYLRFHERPPIVLRGSSQALASALPDASFRLVHIDGAHDYASVRKDIATARRVLCSGGIVVVDDFTTLKDPDVTAAVLDEMRSGGLVPCMLSHVKLYASWSPLPELEPAALLHALRAERGVAAEIRPLLRRDMVVAWGPPTLGYALRTRAPRVYGLLLKMYRSIG